MRSINDSESITEQFHGHFRICLNCGAPISEGLVCPSCGVLCPPTPPGYFTLQTHISTIQCDRCKQLMSCGTTICPGCGNECEYIDPSTVPPNRTKHEALGDLLTVFERIVEERQIAAEAPAMSDQQLLTYINRNDILSSTILDRIKTTAEQINIASEKTIRSPQTRQAMESLLDEARKIRATYDELLTVRISERFEIAQRLLAATYKALLDFCLEIARGILAITIEEVSAAQRNVQGALDRGELAINAFGDEIGRVDPQSLDISATGRLAHLTGKRGDYEHDNRLDFAAVIIDGLSGSTNAAALATIGAGYFAAMIAVEPASLPSDHALSLYLLSAEVASSDDPLTLRRRANVILDILNGAYLANAQAMLAVTEAANADKEAPLVALLSMGDQFRYLQFDKLPRAAQRLTASQAYNTLAEWIFGPLITIVLSARFILKGQPEDYAKTMSRQFGEKFHVLDQESRIADPRYAVALLGVAKIARNAGAHGDVGLSGEKILLREVDKKGKIDTEELTDAEFADRLLDLLLTCRALLLAVDLFCIEHWRELPSSSGSSAPRIIEEGARSVVGMWGIRKATVQLGDLGGSVLIDAVQDVNRPVEAPTDLLIPAYALGTLFRQWSSVCLSVVQPSGAQFKVTIPIAEVMAHASLPQEAQAFGALKLKYLAAIEPTERTGQERYEQDWLIVAARLMNQRVAELQALRLAQPSGGSDYLAQVDTLVRDIELLVGMLHEVPVPTMAASGSIGSLRGRLLHGLGLLRRGLLKHGDLGKLGHWRAIQKGNDLIARGTQAVVAIGNTPST